MPGNAETPAATHPIADTPPVPSTPRLSLAQHLLLAAVFFFAITLRLVYLWGQARNNPMYDHPIMDSAMHDQWARSIAAGNGMGDQPYFRAPLYYYLLAALYKLFGPSLTVARIAGCFAGAFTCYLIARLGVLLAGFASGLLAGFMAALYWPFIYFDAELLTVGLEVLLDVGFLYLILRAAQRDSALLFLSAGIVWGLSAITRPNILGVAPGVAIWLWMAAGPNGPAIRRLRAAALVACGLLLAILPVTIRNYAVSGEPVLIATNGGVNFYIGNNPRSDGFSAIVPGTRASWKGGYYDTHQIVEEELGYKPTEGEVSRYWYSKALAWIRSDPKAWLKLMFHKFRIFWGPIEMPNDHPIWFMARMSGISALFWIGFPVVACLGIAGMVALRLQWRRWFLPFAFLILYMMTVIAFFVCGRYRLPIVPVLILFASAGLCRVAEAVRARQPELLRPYATAGAVAACVLLLFSPKLSLFNTTCDATGYYNLAAHFAEPGPGRRADYKKAIEYYRQSLRLVPQDPRTLHNLAWLLATAPQPELRDGAEALRLVQEADAILATPGWPTLYTQDALAAAFAELGRFDEAVQAGRRELDQASRPGSGLDPVEVQARLRLYEQHRPYRLPS